MAKLPTGTVTLLFTDIEGSTRAWDAGEADMAAALARHDALIHAAADAHGGAVVKSTGDGFMVAFSDAAAAASAAIAAQRALSGESWPESAPVRVRMGIHTGTADERDGDYFGVTPTRAARIMDAGHGGQVLVSGATAGLLSAGLTLLDLGEHPLKGLESPEHVHQLVAEGLQQDFPPLRTARSDRLNLPAERNRFVGRQEEIAAVTKALENGRLVTLTGVGGCGKTRLAIEVARQEGGRFQDGVYFVDLTTVTDDDLIPGAILTALTAPAEVTTGRTPRDGVLAYLARQELLLLLDNCEHLIDGCAELVDDLIDACPEVSVLATSRESLEIEGERAYRVPSLAVPEDDAMALAGDAVRLFVDRAQGADPAFSAEVHQRAIIEICRRLDGIPLAIELAAARVSHLIPEDIAQRLDDRFRLLTGRQRRRVQRQQTLAATLDWSWELLVDDERTLLRRLAVFPGRFRLEEVEGICGFGAATVDLLGSLVDKSLVATLEDHRIPGYRMLETMRLYAEERLVEAGEAEELRSGHQEWFTQWAREMTERPDFLSISKAELMAWELDNVRAALDWAKAGERYDDVATLFFVTDPGVFSGPILDELAQQGDELLSRLDALDPELAPDVALRAAEIAMWTGRFDDMAAHADTAITLAGEDASGRRPLAYALRALRYVFEGERARPDFERAIALASGPDQEPIRRYAVGQLAGVELVLGNTGKAIQLYEEVLAPYEHQEWDGAAEFALMELSIAYLVEDRLDDVRALLARGEQLPGTQYGNFARRRLAILVDIRSGDPLPSMLLETTRDQLRTAVPLGSLVLASAWIESALARGEYERAAELLGCQRAYAIQGGWRSPSQLPLYRDECRRAREHLDDETWRAARDRGGASDLDTMLDRELGRLGVS